jgi:hypothetical protein
MVVVVVIVVVPHHFTSLTSSLNPDSTHDMEILDDLQEQMLIFYSEKLLPCRTLTSYLDTIGTSVLPCNPLRCVAPVLALWPHLLFQPLPLTHLARHLTGMTPWLMQQGLSIDGLITELLPSSGS